MKSKFISVIVSVAVIAGLMLVPAALPAVPAGVALASDNVTIEVESAKVGTDQDFTLNVTINNPSAMPISGAAARMNFSTTFFEVTNIVNGTTLPLTLKWDWDNATGTIDYDGGLLSGFVNGISIHLCKIECHSKSVSGISTVDFVYYTGPPDRLTAVTYGATDYIGGDLGLTVSGTVKVGTPALTVDVIPNGTGSVTANGNLLLGDPNVTYWDWDVDVTLNATNPAPGWTFDHWTGTNDNAVTPTTVTMSDNQSVTANFVPLPPEIGVFVPEPLEFIANEGGINPDPKTFNITNEGGSILSWSVVPKPTWAVNDTWSYWNTYDSVPNASSGGFDPCPNPYYNSTICPVNNTLLNLTVVGEDDDNYYAIADWPIADPQRVASTPYGPMPCCLQDASVVVDKYTLDYVSQLANLTIYLPGQPPLVGQASVTWAYDPGCHGWPYYAGKTWTYTITVVDATGTKYYPSMAMVTAGPIPSGPLAGTYEITHLALPNMTAFMQQYWSDTARNFVFQWDGGTFVAPPVDIRQLQSQSPPPAVPPGPRPPDWAIVNPTAGTLYGNTAISGEDTVTVLADVGTLTENVYYGNITITDPNAINSPQIVPVTFTVRAPTGIIVDRHLPGNATLPNCTYPGQTFDVYVTFDAPVPDLNAISLTDLAPDGWTVTVDPDDCSPRANLTRVAGNKVEIGWFYYNATYSAKYSVYVPQTAKPGINKFPYDVPTAWLEYYFGESVPYTSNITGDYRMKITVPGYVTGETWDVNHWTPLSDTLVTLRRGVGSSVEIRSDESTPDYSIICYNTGDDYFLRASKDRYNTEDTDWVANSTIHPAGWYPAYTQYINWTEPEQLVAGTVINFTGDYGLIPKACTFSYAMKSVNLWLCPPNSEWGLHGWKPQLVIISWQTPS